VTNSILAEAAATVLASGFIYASADEADAYMFYRCCFLFFFAFCFFALSVCHKNTRQPFSGTAERIFMKLYQPIAGKMEFASPYPNGGY